MTTNHSHNDVVSKLRRTLCDPNRKSRVSCTLDEFHQVYVSILKSEQDPLNGLIIKHYHNVRTIYNCEFTGQITEANMGVCIDGVHFVAVDFSQADVFGTLILGANCTFDQRCKGYERYQDSPCNGYQNPPPSPVGVSLELNPEDSISRQQSISLATAHVAFWCSPSATKASSSEVSTPQTSRYVVTSVR